MSPLPRLPRWNCGEPGAGRQARPGVLCYCITCVLCPSGRAGAGQYGRRALADTMSDSGWAAVTQNAEPATGYHWQVCGSRCCLRMPTGIVYSHLRRKLQYFGVRCGLWRLGAAGRTGTMANQGFLNSGLSLPLVAVCLVVVPSSCTGLYHLYTDR